MQEQIDKSAVDPIPDEEAFRRALAQLEAFGKQIFQVAVRQKDLLINEKEQNGRETLLLRKRLDERENELEVLRKNFMDAHMELSEARLTAFKANTVPVGEDQLPMLEQTKEIVRKFNSIYGDTLVEPDILLPENTACLRLPGTDGKAKMSKSLNNCIYLSEEPDEIKQKVFSMFTDPTHIKIEDPGKLEGNTVFTYLDAFCRPEYFEEFLPDYANLDELKAHYQRGGLGDMKVKRFLNNVLQAELEPIRKRRKEYQKDIPYVYEILKKGSEKAESVAAQTLKDVKEAMKINYFEDQELINAQAERFRG